MPFNCCEFTVTYLRRLSFRTASTALTSLGDVPLPLNRRIGGGSFDAGGVQAVRKSAATLEMYWMLRIFTRCEQRLAGSRWFGPPSSIVDSPGSSFVRYSPSEILTRDSLFPVNSDS